MIGYETGGISEMGISHLRNEDRYFYKRVGHLLWMGVFDGISEGGGGDIAAETAKEAMETVLADSTPAVAASIVGMEIVARAHSAIQVRQQEEPGCECISTTAVIACIDRKAGLLHWFSIGDSTLLLCARSGKTEKLTIEDCVKGYLLARGSITTREAREMVAGSALDWYLGKAVGTQELVDHVHLGCVSIHAKVIVLVCSDGLYAHVPEKRIARMVRRKKDMDDMLRGLVKEAKDRGSRDDITLVCARPEIRNAFCFLHRI